MIFETDWETLRQSNPGLARRVDPSSFETFRSARGPVPAFLYFEDLSEDEARRIASSLGRSFVVVEDWPPGASEERGAMPEGEARLFPRSVESMFPTLCLHLSRDEAAWVLKETTVLIVRAGPSEVQLLEKAREGKRDAIDR